MMTNRSQHKPFKPPPHSIMPRPRTDHLKRPHNSLAVALASLQSLGGKRQKTSQPLAVKSVAIGTVSRQQQPCKVWKPHCPASSDPGSAFESDFSHFKRHKAEGKTHSCLRCIYLSNPQAVQQSARLPPTGSSLGMASWLEPKPGYMHGTWGLGCRICAWYLTTKVGQKNDNKRRLHRMKVFKDPQLKARNQPRFSTFANFNFRQTRQIVKSLEQHGNSQAHENACQAIARKEHGLASLSQVHTTAPVAIDPVAQAIFKGRVPKPLDWFDCFVEDKALLSWRKQARLCIEKSRQTSTEPQAQPENPKPDCSTTASTSPSERQLLAAGREETEGHIRKRRQKQTHIMAEVVRQRHRQILRRARFCSLAIDDSSGRKLVHFRCDYHKAPWYYQGTLGVYQSGATTMEEGEQDHASRAMKRLDEFLSRFCTPLRNASLGTQCDEELKKHLLKIVVTISADGGSAERRAIYLACDPGPHLS